MRAPPRRRPPGRRGRPRSSPRRRWARRGSAPWPGASPPWRTPAPPPRRRPAGPPGALGVPESGIRDALDVALLVASGFDALLVGESLLLAADPAAQLRALLGRRDDAEA